LGRVRQKVSFTTGRIYFGDAASNDQGSIRYVHTDNSMRFETDSSERMRIDSNGNVLLGTATAGNQDADNLVVAGTGRTGLTIRSTNADSSRIYFSDATSGSGEYAGYITYEHGVTDALRFGTSTNERMRIDSSGNLLVGKTATDSGVVGFEAAQDGHVYVTVNNTLPLYINRQSGAELLRFASNGATVGSIGVAPSNRLYIGNSDAGLRFLGDSNLITPWNPSTNSNSDNLLDLGNSANRWKDVYVGGGVYLGGTGSANKLDDYEEGTWTPYFGGTSSDPTLTYTNQTGKYCKVGSMVTLHGVIGWSAKSGGAGFLKLAGFPFNGDHAGTEPAVNFSFTTGFSSTSGPVQGGCVHGNNWAYVYKHTNSDARSDIGSGLQTGDLPSSGAVYFTITYRSV